jgi:hypothetical protein
MRKPGFCWDCGAMCLGKGDQDTKPSELEDGPSKTTHPVHSHKAHPSKSFANSFSKLLFPNFQTLLDLLRELFRELFSIHANAVSLPRPQMQEEC